MILTRNLSPAEFKLVAPYAPLGDQPRAIRELTEGLKRGDPYQTLLGVTGSGKTFTMANVIQAAARPTLVISHNKTLAAQLYAEFKSYFPENAVEYFVSYYDYYQPEAYVPHTNTYIEKDASINDDIDRLRLAATSALFERRDVIVVASVSCIYGLGSPEDFRREMLMVQVGEKIARETILSRARAHPLHAERSGPQTRDLPRARRRGRGAPRVRGDRGPDRALRRPGRANLGLRPPDGKDLEGDPDRRHLPREALRHDAGAPQGGNTARSARSWSFVWRSSGPRGSYWKRSGSRCAPSTISR